VREAARFEGRRRGRRKVLLPAVLAAHSLLLSGAIGGEREAMANEDTIVQRIPLPPNWDSLRIDQKFAALHGRAGLVRGTARPGVEVNCDRNSVKDTSAKFSMSFHYPGREGGRFSYRHGEGPFTSGRLESLISDDHPNQRIIVLLGPSIHIGGAKYARIELEEAELKRLADLFQAHSERCVGPGRQHIQTSVALVSRES
jgi:hypothetical protein